MDSKKAALRLSAFIYAMVALLHITRLITGVDLIVHNWLVPLWMNIAGAIITIVLSIWMFRLSTK